MLFLFSSLSIQRQISTDICSGQLCGQGIGSSRPIHLSGHVTSTSSNTSLEKKLIIVKVKFKFMRIFGTIIRICVCRSCGKYFRWWALQKCFIFTHFILHRPTKTHSLQNTFYQLLVQLHVWGWNLFDFKLLQLQISIYLNGCLFPQQSTWYFPTLQD